MGRIQHPVFGPDRFRAARMAYIEWRNAVAAVEAAGGAWASELLRSREREARRIRRMYQEYGDSLLGEDASPDGDVFQGQDLYTGTPCTHEEAAETVFSYVIDKREEAQWIS